MSYSIIYGPPGGFPAYRRTHTIMFYTHQILTREFNDLGGVDWQDIEPEKDEDLPDGAPEVPESQTAATVPSIPEGTAPTGGDPTSTATLEVKEEL